MSSEAPIVLSSSERERLAVFADFVVAGGAGLPSASEAAVHEVWIDREFAVRPDLAQTVMGVLKRPGTPTEVVGALRDKEPALFNAFAFAIAGAYLINPRVRELLGFPGPLPEKNPAFPDEAETFLEGGLLDPVIARGPIWRLAPR